VTRPFLQLLVVAIAGFLLVVAWAIYRIAAQGQVDEARRADAIVVLGAAQFSGQPGGVFEARLQHAVDLYKEHLAPYLIVTGGKLPDDITTEGATARAWAIRHGVPKEAILGEYVWARGDTTWAGALEAVLAERGWTLATTEHGTDGALVQLLRSLPAVVLAERRSDAAKANCRRSRLHPHALAGLSGSCDRPERQRRDALARMLV